MWSFARTTEQVARKDYRCEAAEWLINIGWDDYDLSPDELEIIKKAESENWMIKKGERYIKTSGKFDGEFSVCRARIDLNNICVKHDVYNY